VLVDRDQTKPLETEDYRPEIARASSGRCPRGSIVVRDVLRGGVRAGVAAAQQPGHGRPESVAEAEAAFDLDRGYTDPVWQYALFLFERR
jgi:hypothetical protein